MTAALYREYQDSIDRAQAVSFDVFDTLIHRIAFRPVHVFDLLAKRLQGTDLGLHWPDLLARLPALREVSEREARQRYFERYGTYEITLAEVYDILGEQSGIETDVLARLIHEELALEQAFVYPNPLMKALYEYALGTGKRTILCSDMYLPKEEIEGLLIAAGFQPPFELFVSGQLKISKHEGTLFPAVCAKLGVAPTDLVHFGDNRHADHAVPKALGIRSHHFDRVEREVEPRLRMRDLPQDDRAVGSLVQGVIRKALIDPETPRDFWFDIGLQVFGPLFLGKFLWLARQLRTQQPDKVLFFARDAHLHHGLYVHYGPRLGLTFPADYAYFSRASLLLPSFTEMKLDRLWHLYSGKSTRTVAEHLRRMGIDAAAVLADIQRCGFATPDEPAPNGDPRMHKLLSALYPQLLLQASRQRGLVEQYIGQIVGESRNLAIVDIGWVGNMQSSFSRLLQLQHRDFEIEGYYYGTFEQVTDNYAPRNRFNAWLVNECQPHPWHHALVTGGVELLEFAQMAPHGTTLGYETRDGWVYPVFEHNPADLEVQGLAERVQQGALHFIDMAMPYVERIGFESLVSTAWAEPFYRLITEPTLEEAEHLGEISHSDTATDTSRRILLAEKLSLGRFRKWTPHYRRALETAFWKKGFLVRNQ
jgi:predicted HAD superfamily hydrolase